MLEPPVRPVPTPAGGQVRPQKLPLESRSFESLLDEARDVETDQGPQSASRAPRSTGPSSSKGGILDSLAGLDAIDNALLRQLLTGPIQASSTKTTVD